MYVCWLSSTCLEAENLKVLTVVTEQGYLLLSRAFGNDVMQTCVTEVSVVAVSCMYHCPSIY